MRPFQPTITSGAMPLALAVALACCVAARAHAITTRTLLAPIGAAEGDQFGWSVAGAGDVNGDGYADVIVGAPYNDALGFSTGRAYVYLGGPASDSIADLTLTGPAAWVFFGHSVAGAGDVNADGYDDVIVGAPLGVPGGTDPGRAYVFLGGPGADAVADLTLTGAAAEDEFGYSVAAAGDINGDGYDDVIVGAYQNDSGGPGAGRAYLYHGGPGMDAIADLMLTGPAWFESLGTTVAGAGDVNGDGYDDLIVGAAFSGAGGTQAGRAHLYHGGPAMDTVADLTLTGAAAYDAFGRVAGAGDVNGDGYDDVIIGAQGNDTGGAEAGQAYLYLGGPAMDAVADLTLTGAAVGDRFGWWVAAAGDVNGDGDADFIVGASYNDAGGVDAGRAYVYFGGPGLDAIADLTLTGTAAGEGYGYPVAAAGDVDGDGFTDMILGACTNDAGGADAGRAHVIGVDPASLAVDDPAAGPRRGSASFALGSNPVREEARLLFDLSRESVVTVTAHDLAGREVARPIAAERLPAGRSARAWRPDGLGSGLYFLNAKIGDSTVSTRMARVR